MQRVCIHLQSRGATITQTELEHLVVSAFKNTFKNCLKGTAGLNIQNIKRSVSFHIIVAFDFVKKRKCPVIKLFNSCMII